jgi:hypothetical protein
MIFAFVFTVFIGICAVALIGLEDSHYRVTRLLEELDEQAAQRPATAPATRVAPMLSTQMVSGQQTGDAFGEMAFTRSLLALNKVDSLAPCDSPGPARAESSSSESVRPAQSTDHVQAL